MIKNFFSTPNHRTLALLFAATFIELAGYFMLSPLLTLALHGRGESAGVIGAFAAMGWLALLAGAPYAATLVARMGAQNTLRACAVLPLLSASAYLLTNALVVWFAVAFVGSLASSLRWICSESTVANLSTNATRGRWVSAYSTLVGATFIVGPAGVAALIAALGASSLVPWWCAIGLIAIGAGLTFALRLPAAQQAREPSPAAPLTQMLGIARATPMLVVAGFLAGFFEMGLNSILPVWGLSLGFSESLATLLIAVSAAGGIAGVLAAGWLGQRWANEGLLIVCSAVLLAACGVQGLTTVWPTLAWVVVVLWDAAGAALYILIMVTLGAAHTGTALIQRTAVLVMAYTLGGLFAPLLGGWALQAQLNSAWPVFTVLTSTCAVLGLLALWWCRPARTMDATPRL